MGWEEREFESAYRDLAPRVQTIATRVLRDRSAAEDVVQEVFIELWSRPEAFDATRGSLSAYVSMLARCRALDRIRASAARESAVERALREQAAATVDPAPEESAAEPVLRRERASEVLGALLEVPPPQREAVLLTCAFDLSSRELAEAASVPLGTAKSRVRLGLRRARAALRQAA